MSSLGALAGHRIVPVIVIDDAGAAADLAHALSEGGIGCAEVTFRTNAAADAIAAMAAIEGFTVGAGTVISSEQLHAARDAGATFVVSPGFDAGLVDETRSLGLGVLPGVATASETMAAVNAGFDAVKFFPADRLGGLATIRALAAPFPGIGFVPSGGVTAATAPEYLADPAVPAVSGSWMASRAHLEARDFATIARLSAEATRAIGVRP
ncbi:2-dehydro-3-deoxyphosphogluconate aldolase/(4S)-4-hydroxy-2-oxoglutarate aldolase [Microbacteriaceae bacterium SG_E_30_P1]|uniref:2-dehydro-3-deoxy-phosphogluconate aldolase n=1 Tax=Antiquaquibacter oligotrophicus TaxID=2880260 RepID=A0ABT6KKD2_9MICO|nr:bifunctional 4-hydroxy-2-oxoglutarate aldolase/2-dehydro-3-deoxy-phosphogluconate aldolase [Antiquaquibacter oligotrophicus]MDH6180176.1 2-dehydro-3-deoxyphosphogluconate aldolase/(4S)-4-hydroxy-2-oxoglutarate aldolase [Antiquaquibacter oligotrophicus]UDF14072.1 bifunctional 4-hydroxy-2-oxoglutarate aldolase/2-dehydro-3-deoxy-phosphogluconate aldolase [Antiquaquibacter oligotrophicus]